MPSLNLKIKRLTNVRNVEAISGETLAEGEGEEDGETGEVGSGEYCCMAAMLHSLMPH